MKLSDFDFFLPKILIAQNPVDRRDNSYLLTLSQNGALIKTFFYNIVNFLKPGDLIVLNDSKVLNAKLNVFKNNKKISIYLVKQISHLTWLAFAKPAKKLQEGDIFFFENHKIKLIKKLNTGEIELEFYLWKINFLEFLNLYGKMPLPPYIKRLNDKDNIDANRYQTVYSQHSGSIAAPTAGLHFTNELINKIKKIGVSLEFITLHVGLGTFFPIKNEDIDQHIMHSEYCYIKETVANNINKAKKDGRRIIAVGTTSLRVLESFNMFIQPGEHNIKTFIKPGFKFHLVDALLTNLHLPKSTTFILTCAFIGYQEAFKTYNYAISQKMRFLSYGDSTLLFKKDS